MENQEIIITVFDSPFFNAALVAFVAGGVIAAFKYLKRIIL